MTSLSDGEFLENAPVCNSIECAKSYLKGMAGHKKISYERFLEDTIVEYYEATQVDGLCPALYRSIKNMTQIGKDILKERDDSDLDDLQQRLISNVIDSEQIDESSVETDNIVEKSSSEYVIGDIPANFPAVDNGPKIGSDCWTCGQTVIASVSHVRYSHEDLCDAENKLGNEIMKLEAERDTLNEYTARLQDKYTEVVAERDRLRYDLFAIRSAAIVCESKDTRENLKFLLSCCWSSEPKDGK